MPMNEQYTEKLEKHYMEDGLFTQYPSKRPLRELMLSRIADKFEAEKKYSEKEVNAVIKDSITFNDVELIRRELIDFHYLERLPDGSKYWKNSLPS